MVNKESRCDILTKSQDLLKDSSAPPRADSAYEGSVQHLRRGNCHRLKRSGGSKCKQTSLCTSMANVGAYKKGMRMRFPAPAIVSHVSSYSNARHSMRCSPNFHFTPYKRQAVIRQSALWLRTPDLLQP